jgi:hypothetical protein
MDTGSKTGPGESGKMRVLPGNMNYRVTRAMVRILVVFMLVISLSLPVVENVSSIYCLDIGGTQYDAGQEWFEMCAHLTHSCPETDRCGTDSSGAAAQGSHDLCDMDIDAVGLPNWQADTVYPSSTLLVMEGDSLPPLEPAHSLYKPPKYA